MREVEASVVKGEMEFEPRYTFCLDQDFCRKRSENGTSREALKAFCSEHRWKCSSLRRMF